MKNEMERSNNTEQVLQELIRRYGDAEGNRIFMTVMPSVLADFNGMLQSVPPGKEIRETYRLEDGKGALVLSGMRRENGPQIHAQLI